MMFRFSPLTLQPTPLVIKHASSHLEAPKSQYATPLPISISSTSIFYSYQSSYLLISSSSNLAPNHFRNLCKIMSYSQYGPSQITYGHPRSLVGQHRPSYALSQPVRAAQEAFPPGHYPPDKRSSDFAKVWAACNDNQPFHDQWYQLPSSQFTYCKLAPLHQPATELDDRVSRWTRSVPYPCLLMPQQEIIQHPTRPIPSQCHVIPKSPVRAHQRHVPRNVRRPAPEHNPLGHNEALESPAVLLQAPSRRDRQWYLPSNDKPVRSSKLLHEVTSAAPPVGTVNNVVQSGVPVLNSMKRTHEQSLPVIPTPPEEDMVTPTGVSIGGRPTIRVKSGHERIDDATTMARGHGQSEPFRTPCYIRPADMKTPSDDTTTMATVQALRMMYQNPKTDYGSPPQVSSRPH